MIHGDVRQVIRGSAPHVVHENKPHVIHENTQQKVGTHELRLRVFEDAADDAPLEISVNPEVEYEVLLRQYDELTRVHEQQAAELVKIRERWHSANEGDTDLWVEKGKEPVQVWFDRMDLELPADETDSGLKLRWRYEAADSLHEEHEVHEGHEKSPHPQAWIDFTESIDDDTHASPRLQRVMLYGTAEGEDSKGSFDLHKEYLSKVHGQITREDSGDVHLEAGEPRIWNRVYEGHDAQDGHDTHDVHDAHGETKPTKRLRYIYEVRMDEGSGPQVLYFDSSSGEGASATIDLVTETDGAGRFHPNLPHVNHTGESRILLDPEANTLIELDSEFDLLDGTIGGDSRYRLHTVEGAFLLELDTKVDESSGVLEVIPHIRAREVREDAEECDALLNVEAEVDATRRYINLVPTVKVTKPAKVETRDFSFNLAIR